MWKEKEKKIRTFKGCSIASADEWMKFNVICESTIFRACKRIERCKQFVVHDVRLIPPEYSVRTKYVSWQDYQAENNYKVILIQLLSIDVITVPSVLFCLSCFMFFEHTIRDSEGFSVRTKCSSCLCRIPNIRILFPVWNWIHYVRVRCAQTFRRHRLILTKVKHICLEIKIIYYKTVKVNEWNPGSCRILENLLAISFDTVNGRKRNVIVFCNQWNIEEIRFDSGLTFLLSSTVLELQLGPVVWDTACGNFSPTATKYYKKKLWRLVKNDISYTFHLPNEKALSWESAQCVASNCHAR